MSVLSAFAVALPGFAQEESPEEPAAAAEEAAEPSPAPEADSVEPESDAEPEVEAEAEDPGMTEKDRWYYGRFTAGFDGTWSDSESDIDLDQTLQFNVDPPGLENIHVRSLFWLREDLDSDDERYNTLRDLDDNYDSDVDARVVYLYLDVDDLWGDSTLRFGRQRVQEGPAFNRFDGLYFKQRHARWDWYVFGGWQASMYGDDFEDPVAGGGLSAQLTTSTRVAVDVYWEDDHRHDYDRYIRPRLSNLLYRDFPRDVDGEQEDTRISLSVWQVVTANLTLFGRLDLYSNSGDELTLQATGQIPSWKVTYQATYRRLMSAHEDRASDLTGYYRIFGPEHEYDDFLLVLHRPLGEKFTLTLEGQVHRVDADYPDSWMRAYDHDYDYADRANRDYNRFAVILTADELFWGLSASSSFQVWDVDGGDASWSVGGDVTKKWNDLSLTLGANYERYERDGSRYDFFPQWKNGVRRAIASLNPNSNTAYYDNNFTVRLRDVKPYETNDDIFSVFSRLRWQFAENQDVSLAVSFEEDDSDDSPYWRVRAGYTLEF
ncbi:MAG: hypothetical protein AMXMBFR82_27300 [Candidatus Hydrogenedentota bacterium]